MRNFDWVLPASENRHRSIIVLCVLLFLRTWCASSDRELEDLDMWGTRLPSCRQLVLEIHKHPPCGNSAEGKCIASSYCWSTISKWSLQFCFLASKRKCILSSGETPNTAVYWNLGALEGKKFIFWKTNKQTNKQQKSKMFEFQKKLLVVKRWLFHKNIDVSSSISVSETNSHQLQTSQRVCT